MKTPTGWETAFAARLFDLLSTLESSALIGLAKSRVRGLGEQLAFACLALGASEGLAALESSATTHLWVPVVASRSGHRELGKELPFEAPFSDEKIEMGERLSEVLGLTAEAFFTERMLFELFASALPELLGKDAATSLPQKLLSHLRSMRVTETYRQRIKLATTVGKLTSRSALEGQLAEQVLRVFEGYVTSLEGGEPA